MSSKCDRFEREGLDRFVAGEPPDEHERGCPDCQAERALYQRLTGGIANLPELGPRPDLANRVIAARRTPKVASLPAARPRWIWLVAAAFVGLLAVALILRRPPKEPVAGGDAGVPNTPTGLSPPEPALALKSTLVPASPTPTGEARVGDRLAIHARTAGAAHAELRLYGAREVLLRCPSDPRCTIGASSIDATVLLEAPGSHRTMLLSASAPLPEPGGGFEDDQRAAVVAGARVVVGEPLQVVSAPPHVVSGQAPPPRVDAGR